MAGKKIGFELSFGGRPCIVPQPTVVHQTIIPAPPSYTQSSYVPPSAPSCPPSYDTSVLHDAIIPAPPSYTESGVSNPPPPSYPGPDYSYDTSGAYSWVSTSVHSCDHLIHKAVHAGHEAYDNSPLYLGRAWHEGDLIPCKVNPRHKTAYISHGMREIPVYNIELYCKNSPTISWVSSSCGNVPPGAVPVGHTTTGETLFAARAYHEGALVPGKVHSSHSCCYIAYHGMEISKQTYEVMTLQYN